MAVCKETMETLQDDGMEINGTQMLGGHSTLLKVNQFLCFSLRRPASQVMSKHRDRYIGLAQ